MLKRRLVPRLLVSTSIAGFVGEPVVVTTRRFAGAEVIGALRSQLRVLRANRADEVTLIDLDASRDLRRFDPRVLAQAASEADMPLTFGGGISTLNDISAALDHGADKVVIGAWGRREPHMIAESASRFGSQCIVSAIDVTADMSLHGDRSTGLADLAVQSALAAERNGAGELMVTFVDGDGTGQGLDLRVLSRLRNAVRLPIVAGGGCGKARHVVDALLGAGMDGVSVSTLLARQDQSLMQIRAHAIAAGLSLRSIR